MIKALYEKKRYNLYLSKEMENQFQRLSRFYGEQRLSDIVSRAFDCLEREIGLNHQLKELTHAIIEKNKDK